MSRPLNVVAIVAAYNEEDVIADVVRALITDGVQVYFLDHHSTDGTRAQVEPFKGRGVIGIETFPPGVGDDDSRHRYAWEGILRRKEELSQTLDGDWFIHHDADEFRESPWSGQTLREGIQRVDAAGYNAIDFQLFNFLPTSADRTDLDDVRERLLFYAPGRIFDHQQIKCWKKTGQPVVLTDSGGHSVEFAGRRVFPIRFLLRHYPIRGQAHGERKVFRERLPRLIPGEQARGWHVQYDEFVAGAPFVRDPASLLRYDAEAVRLDLFRRHREVEQLERTAAESREVADRLTAQNTELRRHFEALDAELDWLRPERERLRSDVVLLQRDLDTVRTRLAVTETTLARLQSSPSWKLTAPLRAVQRLLRRSSSEAQVPDDNAKEPDGGEAQTLVDRNPAAPSLGGALMVTRDTHGFWKDRWAGTNLRFRATVTRRIVGLRIEGLVPAELTDGQDLRLRVADLEWAHHAAPGFFDWCVPVSVDPGQEYQFLISASRSWRPIDSGVSHDRRELAWHIVDIEGLEAEPR